MEEVDTAQFDVYIYKKFNENNKWAYTNLNSYKDKDDT